MRMMWMAAAVACMMLAGGPSAPAQDGKEAPKPPAPGKCVGDRPADRPGGCLRCPLHCPPGPPGARPGDRPGPGGEVQDRRGAMREMMEGLTPEEREQLHRFMMRMRQRRMQGGPGGREGCPDDGQGPRLGPGPRPGQGPGGRPGQGPPPPDRERPRGNNGVGNGEDPQPPGNPPVNDGPGTGPGNPGRRGGQGGGRR